MVRGWCEWTCRAASRQPCWWGGPCQASMWRGARGGATSGGLAAADPPRAEWKRPGWGGPTALRTGRSAASAPPGRQLLPTDPAQARLPPTRWYQRSSPGDPWRTAEGEEGRRSPSSAARRSRQAGTLWWGGGAWRKACTAPPPATRSRKASRGAEPGVWRGMGGLWWRWWAGTKARWLSRRRWEVGVRWAAKVGCRAGRSGRGGAGVVSWEVREKHWRGEGWAGGAVWPSASSSAKRKPDKSHRAEDNVTSWTSGFSLCWILSLCETQEHLCRFRHVNTGE